MPDTPIMTRYAAECTRTYLHSTMHCGQVYMAPTGMLLDWLETIIALHQLLEAAGVTVPVSEEAKE
jgi:hypothetical protein